MAFLKKSMLISLVLCIFGTAFSASVILNEYNAVDSDGYLGGGTLAADESGTRASDSYFGRVLGNGGDWFELVVITDHLDMRNWQLDIYEDGILDETLTLTAHSLWSDLRSGTIITVAEDVPTDVSYNPAAGDWWINVRANNDQSGAYIEASNFPVGSSNWQLRIRNAAGVVVFGPAGEGVSPASGVGGDEIFRLEADPSALITANSTDYDDASSLSTFGAPNQWGSQDIDQLRKVVTIPAATLTLTSPDGGEVLRSQAVYPITWTTSGAVDRVRIEFSIDNGITWTDVYPPNTANTGAYDWLVPAVNSQAARVRIRHAGSPAIADTSSAPFTIYECPLEADITGDCLVDMNDLTALAAAWLNCANPFDPDCMF